MLRVMAVTALPLQLRLQLSLQLRLSISKRAWLMHDGPARLQAARPTAGPSAARPRGGDVRVTADATAVGPATMTPVGSQMRRAD
eukprot:scaffold54553_cov30-Tisochrysis_lutea.AAC.4